MIKRTCIACALVAACTDDSRPPSTPPNITGSLRVMHWDLAGSATAVPDRADLLYIEAQIPSDETTVVIPARVHDDATFTIDASPTGPYWLRVVDNRRVSEDVYLWTDALTLDLGRDVVGSDTGLAASVATQLVFDGDGLSPWQESDDGDLYLPALGYWSAIETYFATNAPSLGDTGVHALTYDWQAEPLPPPAGDDAYLVQLQQFDAPTVGIKGLAPVTMLHADHVSIAEAGTTHVAGAFTDVPPRDIAVRVPRTQFVAQTVAAATCMPTLSAEELWVHAQPAHGGHGSPARAFSPQFLEVPDDGARVVHDVQFADASDLDGTLHVASPYPADWLYSKYAATFDITCPIPGITGVFEGTAAVGAIVPGDAVIAPSVTPVQAPNIALPTLSWTPPAVGAPTSYELHLSTIVPSGGFGGPRSRESAVLIVPGDVTSIALPHELFAPDALYVFRIRAVVEPGQATRTAPFRSGSPYGYADLYTTVFQP
jgi:hypothetical protein